MINLLKIQRNPGFNNITIIIIEAHIGIGMNIGIIDENIRIIVNLNIMLSRETYN